MDGVSLRRNPIAMTRLKPAWARSPYRSRDNLRSGEDGASQLLRRYDVME
jgi:hypothetical protein